MLSNIASSPHDRVTQRTSPTCQGPSCLSASGFGRCSDCFWVFNPFLAPWVQGKAPAEFVTSLLLSEIAMTLAGGFWGMKTEGLVGWDVVDFLKLMVEIHNLNGML